MYTVFREIDRSDRQYKLLDRSRPDVVSAPTEIYDPMFVFEYSPTPKHPAVTMSRYAAKQYTKWLSAITKLQYRLPTEAEWEYACRAGAKTAFYWGDDPKQAEKHCWFFDNQPQNKVDGNFEVSVVGQKPPNAFGLHDMIGNVGEWTADAYSTDTYQDLWGQQQKTGKPIGAIQAVQLPTKDEPGIVRGGNCDNDPSQLRCAARLKSDEKEWQSGDADFPPSPWWYSSDPVQMIGFRVFRSYEELPKQTISKFWNHTSSIVKQDVESKMQEGRGAAGIINKALEDRVKQSILRKKASQNH